MGAPREQVTNATEGTTEQGPPLTPTAKPAQIAEAPLAPQLPVTGDAAKGEQLFKNAGLPFARSGRKHCWPQPCWCFWEKGRSDAEL
jgi:hypothetical protein